LTYFEQLKIERHPKLGDVLFSVTGSIGIPALVDTEEPFTFQRHIAILRPDHSQILSSYLLFALAADNIQQQGLAVATGTAQLTIPLAGLRSFIISIPPTVEQQEIVRRVEILFSYADRLETRYAAVRTRVELLTPTLLTKAFRGELVTQDPADEPASILLERIRAARSAERSTPSRLKASRRPTMSKLTAASVKSIISQLPDDGFTFDDLRDQIPVDYENLKEILFELLAESQPSLKQVFEENKDRMVFERPRP
jgi:type I restriction enzyme S subunit